MLLKRSHVFLMLLSMGILWWFSCTRQAQTPRLVVARVGNRSIDWDHLQRSFELKPKWGRGITRAEAYRNQLNYLIDEKLFAQAAERDGLLRDTTLAARLHFVEEKELIKELYRQEVADKIRISDDEYQEAYGNLKKKVKLAYVFTPDSLRAWQYYKNWLEKGVGKMILLDVNNDHRGVTPFFGFGDMEAALETVAFRLKQGEVSRPVRVNGGFMVVQLIAGEVEKFQSKVDFAEKKNKIRKVIFERRASRVSNQFIKNFMLDKNLQLNPPVFYRLAGELSRIIQNKTSETPLPLYVSDRELQTTAHDLASLKKEVLITFRDGEMTVGEFLKHLSHMPAHLRPNLKQPKKLKDAIGVAVRNMYLAQEARRRGLARAPRAKREIRIQSDEILAGYWVKQQAQKIRVPEQEVRAFRESEKFPQLISELGHEPDNAEIAGIIRRIRLMDLKVAASDSLRRLFTVKVDSMVLKQKIKRPEELINYQPAPVVVRDLFN